MNVVTLTDDNFTSEVSESDKPVLVDYWATWCGPCKMVGPIVEEIAIEFSDKLKVGKLDVDANQTIFIEEGSSPLSIEDNNRSVFN